MCAARLPGRARRVSSRDCSSARAWIRRVEPRASSFELGPHICAASQRLCERQTGAGKNLFARFSRSRPAIAEAELRSLRSSILTPTQHVTDGRRTFNQHPIGPEVTWRLAAGRSRLAGQCRDRRRRCSWRRLSSEAAAASRQQSGRRSSFADFARLLDHASQYLLAHLTKTNDRSSGERARAPALLMQFSRKPLESNNKRSRQRRRRQQQQFN